MQAEEDRKLCGDPGDPALTGASPTQADFNTACEV